MSYAKGQRYFLLWNYNHLATESPHLESMRAKYWKAGCCTKLSNGMNSIAVATSNRKLFWHVNFPEPPNHQKNLEMSQTNAYSAVMVRANENLNLVLESGIM